MGLDAHAKAIDKYLVLQARLTVGKFDWKSIDNSVVDETLNNLRGDVADIAGGQVSHFKTTDATGGNQRSETEQSDSTQGNEATVEEMAVKHPIHSVDSLEQEKGRLRAGTSKRREARSEETGSRKIRTKGRSRAARLKAAGNDAGTVKSVVMGSEEP